MRKIVASLAVILMSWPLIAGAQDGRATLENVAKAMGAAGLKSIEYSGTGDSFSVGQTVTPGKAWPRFTLKSYTQAANYETASLRRDQVVVRVDVRGGGVPAMGEARQIVVVSGDHAWTVAGETASPQPRFRTEQQLQLWATPHGVVKAAMANNATVEGRTITFAVPGRFTAKATVDDQNLVDPGRGRLHEPGGRRHAGRGDLFRLPGLRRREVPDEDQAVGRRLPGPRSHGERGEAQRPRGHRRARCRSPEPQSLREGDEPVRGRGHLVPDRRQPPQRGDRDEGPRDRRRGSARRHARAGRDRRGPEPGAGQAHPLRRQQPPALRPLGRRAGLRGGGRDRDHPRDQPRLLRGGPGRAGPDQPRPPGEVGAEGDGGRRAATRRS